VPPAWHHCMYPPLYPFSAFGRERIRRPFVRRRLTTETPGRTPRESQSPERQDRAEYAHLKKPVPAPGFTRRLCRNFAVAYGTLPSKGDAAVAEKLCPAESFSSQPLTDQQQDDQSDQYVGVPNRFGREFSDSDLSAGGQVVQHVARVDDRIEVTL